MELYQDGVEVHVLPEDAICNADQHKRNPLSIEACPLGYETCTEECDEYREAY